MITTQQEITFEELVVSAATLPFCAPQKDSASRYRFDCGLELSFIAQQLFTYVNEQAVNTLTNQIRFAHAKHHIDGHLKASWNLVAKQLDTDKYLVWCDCDD